MPPGARNGPLTETVFYVLLALHSPLHGYGIMQLVDEITGGRVVFGPGTLYGALTALTERGWITPVSEAKGGRKKEYVITDAGRSAVLDELERLEEVLQNGRRIAGGDTR